MIGRARDFPLGLAHFTAIELPPAEFVAHIKAELAKWASVARAAKIEPQ